MTIDAQSAADVAVNLVSDAVWWIIGIAVASILWITRRLSTRIRWLATSWTARLFVWFFLTFCASLAAVQVAPLSYVAAGTILSLVIAPFWILRNFRTLGLGLAFDRTTRGIDFERSLKLARSDFAFLGIGAHKLVGAQAFEDAMQRCATDGRIARFLLSDPSNPSLERMARRNNIDPSIYKRRVEESIGRLRSLREERGLNIEIALYSSDIDADFQRFRLVFIDKAYCLLSWTAWGTHEGRDNPQIVLRNRGNSQTMYKAFDDYFALLWNNSERIC